MPRPFRAAAGAVVCGVVCGVVCAAVAGCSGSTPDPGELAGVDADGDGVRDDVATAISGFDPALREHLFAVAANEQLVVTFDPDAPGAAERAWGVAQEANRLVSCTPDGVELTVAISGRSFPEPDCDPTTTSAPLAP